MMRRLIGPPGCTGSLAHARPYQHPLPTRRGSLQRSPHRTSNVRAYTLRVREQLRYVLLRRGVNRHPVRVCSCLPSGPQKLCPYIETIARLSCINLEIRGLSVLQISLSTVGSTTQARMKCGTARHGRLQRARRAQTGSYNHAIAYVQSK